MTAAARRRLTAAARRRLTAAARPLTAAARSLPLAIASVVACLLAWAAPAAADQTWTSPLAPPPTVVQAFEAPPGPYAAGHRGVDIASLPGTPVLAAGDGVVAFAGRVAGRGVVSVDHVGGLRTTYEPVTATVRRGDAVARGQQVGLLTGVGGHCQPQTCLHWGLRRGSTYLDPLGLLGGQRVRLLPVWSVAPEAADTADTKPVLSPVPEPSGSGTVGQSPLAPAGLALAGGLAAAAMVVRRRSLPLGRGTGESPNGVSPFAAARRAHALTGSAAVRPRDARRALTGCPHSRLRAGHTRLPDLADERMSQSWHCSILGMSRARIAAQPRRGVNVASFRPVLPSFTHG